MGFERRIKKMVVVIAFVVFISFGVPVVSRAVFTGTPVIGFIQKVQDMNKNDREWVRDNILNPLTDDASLVSAKAQELKGRFPGVNISSVDLESALKVFADTDNSIQQKVITHLIAGKQTVRYTTGSFDVLKNKIEANVSSLENLVSGLVLLQDITGLDPVFTDKNSAEGTMELRKLVTGSMVGGDNILDQLDKAVQTIAGLHFGNLNLVLVGYTEILNSYGTAVERINFEKFLFSYGAHNGEHLYEGKNAKKHSSGRDNDNKPPPAPPELEGDTGPGQQGNNVIEKVLKVDADAGGAAKISDQQAAQIIREIDTLAAQAEQDADAKTELVIAIQGKNDLSQSSINIPSNIISEAAAKNIDMIKVSSPVAEITVPTESLRAAGAAAVDIKAEIIDKEKELTVEQRAVVGDSPVYDFSITAVTSSGNTRIRNFGTGLQISIPYTLREGDNPDNITVFYLNDNDEPENMQGVYDPSTGSVSFIAAHLSKYYIKSNNVVFNDLTKHQWAKAYIESMAAKGIINGKSKGLYNPGDNVTRAEFAALLVKLLRIRDSGKTLKFKDVSPEAWYYSTVASAVEHGIITGKEGGIFAPEENISRQDMAVMVGMVLKKLKNSGSSADTKLDFIDNTYISDYALEGVSMAVKYGIIKGNSDRTFKPLNNATRAEAAVVIYKIFNLK